MCATTNSIFCSTSICRADPIRSHPLLSFPDFTLVSASAGAGKTYALALRYITLLLADGVPAQDLSSILAITFTNNAAAEMRQRILRFLKSLCVGGDDALMDAVMAQTGLAAEEVRRRAGAIVSTVLERYSDFQVRTIDSFLARMVKASSLDLGIPPDFELQLDPRPVLEYAFELFGATLRPGEPATAALLRLADDLAVRHGADARVLWDPFGTVREGVGALRETLAPVIAPLVQTTTAEDLKARVQELERIASGLQEFITRHDLPVTRYFADDLTLVAGGDWRAMLRRTPRQDNYTKKGKAAQEAALARHRGALHSMVEEFYGAMSRVVETAARFDARPFADAYAAMVHHLDTARAVSGQFGFEEITRRLVTYLQTGAVPDIYLMLGESLSHFLIDEFQDTSPLQWAAFHPLLENALAADGSLFIVGDTKQSIFGFRGADWRIMQRLASGTEAFPSVPVRQLQLANNRRSDEAIVEYVASTFESIAGRGGSDAEAAAQSGLQHCRQTPLPGRRGRGHVETLRLSYNEDVPAERDAIVKIIHDAVKRGYGHGDIAVITPGNEHVVTVGAWLNHEGIPFVSHSTLDIRARRVIGEFLALLRFLDTPVDSLSFATFMLGDLFAAALHARRPRIEAAALQDLAARLRDAGGSPLYTLFREQFPEVWEASFAPLFSGIGHLPLYDLVCEACKTFDVFTLFPHEEGAFLKLLEAVNGFEQDGHNSMKEFLAFASGATGEDEAVWTLDPPSRTAVTLMTIHKAKGMEFPIVIVLYHDTHQRAPVNARDDSGGGVEIVRVNSKMALWSPSVKAVYDREMRNGLTDLFNLLYVALTRAEQELYVLAVGDPSKTDRFPTRVLMPAGGTGSTRPPARPERHGRESDIRGVTPLHATARINVTVATQKQIGYWATRRGELVHAILSQLTVVSDPEVSLEAAARSIPAAEWAEIKPVLVDFLRTPEVLPFFTERQERTVVNELEVVAREGNLLRVDRIVVDPTEVAVLDFKTGATEDPEEYSSQIRHYMSVAQDIFPGRSISGFIAYVDRRVVRRVS